MRREENNSSTATIPDLSQQARRRQVGVGEFKKENTEDMNGEWEDLRREARRLEGKLEEKVQAYSRLAQQMNSDILYDDENPLLDSHEEQMLAIDIEHLLSALSECNEKIASVVSSGSRAANTGILQRYREILFDYTTEFKKTSLAIQRKRESAELLRSSRKKHVGSTGEDSHMEHLLRERNAIQNSFRSVSNIIGQALETKENLRLQGGVLRGTNSTLGGLSNNLPSISRVIDSIHRKKNRDNMVVAAVIAGCICFTLWWILG